MEERRRKKRVNQDGLSKDYIEIKTENLNDNKAIKSKLSPIYNKFKIIYQNKYSCLIQCLLLFIIKILIIITIYRYYGKNCKNNKNINIKPNNNINMHHYNINPIIPYKIKNDVTNQLSYLIQNSYQNIHLNINKDMEDTFHIECRSSNFMYNYKIPNTNYIDNYLKRIGFKYQVPHKYLMKTCINDKNEDNGCKMFTTFMRLGFLNKLSGDINDFNDDINNPLCYGLNIKMNDKNYGNTLYDPRWIFKQINLYINSTQNDDMDTTFLLKFYGFNDERELISFFNILECNGEQTWIFKTIDGDIKLFDDIGMMRKLFLTRKETELTPCVSNAVHTIENPSDILELGFILNMVPHEDELGKYTTKYYTAKTEAYMVQEFVENPLLINNAKFNIRSYFMIANMEPYIVFYCDSIVFMAIDEYNKDELDIESFKSTLYFEDKIFNQIRKLNNDGNNDELNDNNLENSNENESNDDESSEPDDDNEYIMSLKELNIELKKLPQHQDVVQIVSQIEEIGKIVLNSFQFGLNHERMNSDNDDNNEEMNDIQHIELVSMDFVLNTEFELKLISIKGNPTFKYYDYNNCEINKLWFCDFVDNVFNEAINIGIEIDYKRKLFKKITEIESLNNFEIISMK